MQWIHPIFCSTNIARSVVYKVAESVRSTHGRDGAIVLDIGQGQIFNLNLVGSRILELLESGTPESAIADTISQEFGVSKDVVDEDMQEFIRVLEERQLVEVVK